MSLKRILAKALISVALVSSFYGLPTKKANAFKIIYPNGLVVEYIGTIDKTTRQTSNIKNLYKQNTNKQKQEFTPPELPYCKINYAGRKGINVTYWTKDGKKYDLSWAVTNVTAGIGGATVSLRALYTNGNYSVYELSSTDYSKLVNCVAEAAKDAIAGPHYNPGVDVDKLYLKQVKGDLKNYSVFKFREYR